jgi:uncharacterized protein YegP (UPF0339 family)
MGRPALRHGVTVEHRSHDQLDSADERPVDAGLLEQERQAHLHDAVDALSPRLRFVVSGFYFQDRQVKDLAPVLGVSASRVSKMHAEALSHLRDTLEEHMRVVIYFAKDGWRWRAQARNGEIVSESGEAYEDKSYAIQSAKEFGPTNAVIFTDD